MPELITADAVAWAESYDGPPFHGLLCDPPYELGFMGKRWDASGIAFLSSTWAAFSRVLHPGAFGMAFASSRGWHRLACAIEDAGFVIHPSIFGWCFGSGFPKATRVRDGREVETGEVEVLSDIRSGSMHAGRDTSKTYTRAKTVNLSPFSGHRYGLQALKPALEPVIVFQKPYAGKPVECITKTGAGALNIDGGRIGTEGGTKRGDGPTWPGSSFNCHSSIETISAGRWPANFFTDADAARRLDEQSGEVGNGHWSHKPAKDGGIYAYGLKDMPDGGRDGKQPGASRFFFRVAEQLDDADPVRYCAKASTREREAGLEGRDAVRCGGMQATADGSMLTGSGNERTTTRANHHPTVKPIALAKWLATLLLPPAEYAPRRLFVPFAGVASEMVGAAQAGWDEVVGVEQSPEYAEIGRARLAHYYGAEAGPLFVEQEAVACGG